MVQRVGVVTNYASNRDIRNSFDRARGIFETMGLACREIRVPFESASFETRRIEEHRAAVNEELFADIDAIALPTLAAPPPSIVDARTRGDMAVGPENTFFSNYYGLPAISVPSGVDKNGLPLGLQFVGPQGGDDAVLRIARRYQQASAWHFTPPRSLASSDS
jgi:aspartyl-tRNA(Asn)/glutamyl-tRNA(Gln) amidotransferase subunit A